MGVARTTATAPLPRPAGAGLDMGCWSRQHGDGSGNEQRGHDGAHKLRYDDSVFFACWGLVTVAGVTVQAGYRGLAGRETPG